MADVRSQLAWIHRNRSKPDRTAPLARLVQRWAEGVDEAEGRLARELAAALTGVVDETFARCCFIGGVHDGVVLVNVADASSVGWMRRTWRSKLQQAARARFPRAKIRDVRFAFGTDGEAVGAPDEQRQ